jgi:hypothetical protein
VRQLATSNGWYVQNGRAIWGYGLHNDWWGGYRGLPTGWWTDCPLRPSLRGKVLSLGALDWRPWLLRLKQRGE